MSYYHDQTPADGMLYDLASQAGASGDFEIVEVIERVHEAGGETGGFAVEVWLEFRVQPYGYDREPETRYLPGTLYWNLTRVYRKTLTIPVSHA